LPIDVNSKGSALESKRITKTNVRILYLVKSLDKNQLYVNLSSKNDKDCAISLYEKSIKRFLPNKK
jgi:hypothetical protein